MAVAARPRALVRLDKPPRPAGARQLFIPPPDFLWLVSLAPLTLLIQSHLLASETLVGLDSATQFYPWYAFLGQNLRAGHIPGWNPSAFSGTPFAADPLSGWTYIPAMLLFTVLPVSAAAKAYLVFHPLLAAFSTFALGRKLGLDRPGAFVAALAYANSGFLQIQNTCCFAFASVYAWLPVALLGAECAIRATGWSTRAAWWGLAALAVSQILAAWLGQGTYYAALLIGAYLLFRTVVLPGSGRTVPGLLQRIGTLLLHLTGVFVFGLALDAAGWLPRMEFNALSNLAGGYLGANTRVGGLRPEQWVFLATPGIWYVGVSVLLLGLAAVLVARRRLDARIWYFGVASGIALVLSDASETPLDRLLFRLLPAFAELHRHAPERILTVGYLGPALFAGVTVSLLLTRTARWAVSVRAAVLAFVVLAIATDLAVGGAQARTDRLLKDPLDGVDAFARVDLARLYQPSDAAVFLQQRVGETPSRYFGYAPEVDGRPLAYTVRFLDGGASALLVNNRAVTLGLQDIQGYDPSHLRRYDAYLAALNGATQDYHDANVLAAGLSSPLLDLLNARSIVVPSAAQPDRNDARVPQRYVQVYADQSVRILDNPTAFPRAWLVHDAVQIPAGGANALALIGSGQIDARHDAVLEEPPPALQTPSDPSLDEAHVTGSRGDADDLAAQTFSSAPGLLVLSEIYYPAWKAYVDGRPAHLYVADGLLRAVAVPSGQHTVELRFESDALAVGVVVSAIALMLLVLTSLGAFVSIVVRR